MAVVFDKDICDEIRNKFLALAPAQDKYYEADLERLKVDDVYVSRFLTHQKEVSRGGGVKEGRFALGLGGHVSSVILVLISYFQDEKDVSKYTPNVRTMT